MTTRRHSCMVIFHVTYFFYSIDQFICCLCVQDSVMQTQATRKNVITKVKAASDFACTRFEVTLTVQFVLG